MKSLSRARPSATPWTAAFQAPPSMGFSRQEYWSGAPLPSPRKPEGTPQTLVEGSLESCHMGVGGSGCRPGNLRCDKPQMHVGHRPCPAKTHTIELLPPGTPLPPRSPPCRGGHPRTPKGRAFPSHSSICDLGQRAEERGNLNLYVGPGLLWEFYENEGLETTYLT